MRARGWLGRLRVLAARAVAPVPGCDHCGLPWPFCASDPHETRVADDVALDPLCEDCWAALGPAGRRPYYEAILRRWGEAARPGIAAAVRRAVEAEGGA